MVIIKAKSDEQARKEYADFEEVVKRTVLLDDLSPTVTPSVIAKALNQFGDVVKVEFIPNYTIPYPIPQCALVEMKNPKQAAGVIAEITNHPFMIRGMPRPVRALPAEPEMFADRPSPPGREIEVRWVEPSDPDFEVGRKLKMMCRNHAAETLALTKATLAEGEKLVKQHKVTLEANYRKYELTEDLKKNGTVGYLANKYGMRFEGYD